MTTFTYLQAVEEVKADIRTGAIVAGCPFYSTYGSPGWVLGYEPDEPGGKIRIEVREYLSL